MAKQRVRELVKNGNGVREITPSSGITVSLLPFPFGLWEEVNIKAFKDFPDPLPPKKTIKVLDGTEEIDDLDNPDYKAGLKKAENERGSLLLEAVMEVCPQIDLSKFEREIKRLEKYSQPFSEDPDERRVEFLSRYVFRTKADFEELMISAVEQIIIDDPEVSERIRYFQSQLEGTATSDPDAPGAA